MLCAFGLVSFTLFVFCLLFHLLVFSICATCPVRLSLLSPGYLFLCHCDTTLFCLVRSRFTSSFYLYRLLSLYFPLNFWLPIHLPFLSSFLSLLVSSLVSPSWPRCDSSIFFFFFSSFFSLSDTGTNMMIIFLSFPMGEQTT